MTIQKTPLHDIHRAYGAKLIDFAGWQMPVQYTTGALKEHLAVRSGAGVFDVSHMGELEIRGRTALSFVQKVTCNDVSRLSDQQAQYSAFLYPEGTFVDDVVVYRFHEQHFLICVNAANREKDFAWLNQQNKEGATLEDNSAQYVQLAVQGPVAQNVLQKLTDVDLSAIKFYWFQEGDMAGVSAIISRTGYTGEDGFELYFAPEHAEKVWNLIFEAGKDESIVAAGLAARNTLRLEVKYPLYGNDISDRTTPLEAGLGWIVKLAKGDFVGSDSLQKQKEKGVEKRLIGFEMIDRGIARDHYPVFLDGEKSGEVTSGTFGPSVDKAIGMTYLPSSQAQTGRRLEVEIRGNRLRAQVAETPFYKKAD